MKTVVVGMSGGVDSSVAALLLKRQGYKVIGLFMKNWEEEDDSGICTATSDYEDVVRVCEAIGIPHYSVNFSKTYWDKVFSRCLADFEKGYTPNPDILCNQEVKFKVFFEKAMSLQADFLATGHYCRKITDGQYVYLARGVDENKDQSYFLYTMKESVLKKVLFPLGDLTKPEIREIAKEAGLATASKKDSTGICFIGKRNFKEFLSSFIPKNPGKFVDKNGKVLGLHDGYPYYTIGQRKGLGIGGAGEAWFVAKKDVEKNEVLLVQGESDPLLYRQEITASTMRWVAEKSPEFPFSCTAKIRYRSKDVNCRLEKHDDQRIKVVFDEAQKAVTPRQSIVFYENERCLGGALID